MPSQEEQDHLPSRGHPRPGSGLSARKTPAEHKLEQLLGLVLPRPADVAWKENRRYMAGYLLPKDRAESRRLDLQHVVLFRFLGGNVLAPLQAPRRILDAACGTGFWCRQVAQQFKGAQVVGFDRDLEPLREIQKELGRKGAMPKGCRFEEADALGPLPYPDASFDYTHSRFVAPFMLLDAWPRYVGELTRVLRPGGWLELVEGPLPVGEHAGYRAIRDALVLLSHRRLGYFDIGPTLPGMLEEAGLTSVVLESSSLGPDTRPDLMADLAENMRQGFTNSAPTLLRAGLFTETDLAAHLAAMKATALMLTWQLYVVYGQKP